MGRELKRKQARKEGKSVKDIQKDYDKPLETKTFITIIIIILFLFAVIYIVTGVFVTKEITWFQKKDDNTTEDKVITNKILAIDSLKQNEEKYYVYYYDSKEEDSAVSSNVSSLTDKVYRVDLSDGFNSNYTSEVSSGIVENITDLKVIDPTVIKVELNSIVEFYSGKEEISFIK